MTPENMIPKPWKELSYSIMTNRHLRIKKTISELWRTVVITDDNLGILKIQTTVSLIRDRDKKR